MILNTVKRLKSGHLRVLKNFFVIERCPLLGGNLKKIITYGTKRFVRCSRHVRYLECPLLGGFTIHWYICRTTGLIDEVYFQSRLPSEVLNNSDTDSPLVGLSMVHWNSCLEWQLTKPRDHKIKAVLRKCL